MPKGIMSEGWNVDTLVAAGAGISMDSPSRDFCWVMVFIFHALPPAGFLRDQGGVVERWKRSCQRERQCLRRWSFFVPSRRGCWRPPDEGRVGPLISFAGQGCSSFTHYPPQASCGIRVVWWKMETLCTLHPLPPAGFLRDQGGVIERVEVRLSSPSILPPAGSPRRLPVGQGWFWWEKHVPLLPRLPRLPPPSPPSPLSLFPLKSEFGF